MRRPDRLLLALAAVLFLAALGRDAADRWIAATQLPPLVAETSVEVLDRAGAPLRIYTVADGLWRLDVTADAVDPRYLAMLRAYEDKRFDHHAGVDPLALLRAAGQAVWHGRVISGGSTLTMQVARLLEGSGTGTWAGKLRQMRVALALERRLSKRQILDLYLARAPFGGNLEGVRAATLAWFGKEPGRLTPAEAALLVALPQSPEARRPDRHRRAARVARDRVLARMQKAGVLSPEAVHAALTEPVPVERRGFPANAPHLADRAVAQAPFAGDHRLTLDAGLQRRLERLARRTVASLPPETSIAMLVADHRTGAILASVGSADYAAPRQGYVDMTRAARSPGSVLKPLIYALAFDRGLAHPRTLIPDRPVSFGTYAPQNFDGGFRGDLPVAEALRLSLNVPAVLLLDEIGPARLMAAMRRAGLAPDLPGDQAGLAVAWAGSGCRYTSLCSFTPGWPTRGRRGRCTGGRVRLRGRAPGLSAAHRPGKWATSSPIWCRLPALLLAGWPTKRGRPTGTGMPGPWDTTGRTSPGSGSAGPMARRCRAPSAATWPRRCFSTFSSA